MQCMRKTDDGILLDKRRMQTMKNENLAFWPESSQTKVASSMDLPSLNRTCFFLCSTLNSSSLAYTFLKDEENSA